MIREFTMAKRELSIPPIRKNPRIGRVNQHDAAVVVGNSKPDVKVSTKTKQKTTNGHTVGIPNVAKRKPKRNKRIYFVPNKVAKSKLTGWRKKYGRSFYLSIINTAIEKYEP